MPSITDTFRKHRPPRSTGERAGSLLAVLLCVALPASCPASGSSEVWFDAPARQLIEEGLPIGNGRLGMLIGGGIHHDRIAVNEDSVWTGWVNRSANNPAAAESLESIRGMFWNGQVLEAQQRVTTTQVPTMTDPEGRSLWDAYGSYQMLAFLDLAFQHPEGEVRDYSRLLDLENARVEVAYTIGDVRFRREFVASYPDQVLVARFSADTPAAVSLEARLGRPDTGAVSAVVGDTLVLSGGAPDGLNFEARLGARSNGGERRVRGDALVIRGADEVMLVLSAATNYLGARAWPGKLGGDPARRNSGHLNAALEQDWVSLSTRQREDYRELYTRVSLDLGASPPALAGLTTPGRLAMPGGAAADPDLLELYFNFGRYLLISSSRPGSLAANLQGLWAVAEPDPESGRYRYETPWNGDYHSNINLQMNYWPVDVTGLPECFEPLDDLIHGMAAAGAETARIQHGARGWTLHTLHNPWGYTAPGEVASWGHFPMAGPWVARHLWDHYAFTQDRAFLQRSWPVLRGSAEFVLDWLVEEPESGLLVSGPAGSPENRFLLPGGETGYFSMGPAMDQSIARDLFGNVLDAAALLGIDDEFTASVAAARARLAPLRIGDDGRILEWAQPWAEAEPGHRHISHLFGLHPGHEISPVATPGLASAARKTIDYRLAHGGGHTGWSRAWIVNFFARLNDGAAAYENLLALLEQSTLPNLFDTHPPFQIDGNFGATAGIAEMLLQSQLPAGDGSFPVELLPALPSAWPDGHAKGLRARGGFVLDFSWRGGELVELRAESLAGRELHLRWGGQGVDRATQAGEVFEWRPARPAEPEAAR